MILSRTKSLRFQLSVWLLATTTLILLAASVLCFSLVCLALLQSLISFVQERKAHNWRRLLQANFSACPLNALLWNKSPACPKKPILTPFQYHFSSQKQRPSLPRFD